MSVLFTQLKHQYIVSHFYTPKLQRLLSTYQLTVLPCAYRVWNDVSGRRQLLQYYCDKDEWLCDEIWKWSITIKCGKATEEFSVWNREHVPDEQCLGRDINTFWCCFYYIQPIYVIQWKLYKCRCRELLPHHVFMDCTANTPQVKQYRCVHNTPSFGRASSSQESW